MEIDNELRELMNAAIMKEGEYKELFIVKLKGKFALLAVSQDKKEVNCYKFDLQTAKNIHEELSMRIKIAEKEK